MKWYILTSLFVIVCGETGPKVDIKYGKLEGKYITTRKGRDISGFLGIPFAKPPVNELRFKDTEPTEPWLGIRKAVQDGPTCIQKDIFTENSHDVEGSEDCLYLNVYTPKLPKDGNKLFPVMVYIHEGGFFRGSGNSLMYGPDYLLDEDIVLVVPNYRLGPLGFLSTQDNVVAGNMGLKDQVQALKWVQESISSFGGDPNQVSIFGVSAGGASVHHHMVSSLSRGLFHRAIAQSGTSICPWALAQEGESKRNTEKLAKSLNCPTHNSKEMVECLQKVDANKLFGTMQQFFEWDTEPVIPFKPVIEHNHPNAFISEHPRHILEKGQANNVPLILGLSSSEGCLKTAWIYPKQKLLNEFSKNFDKIIPMIFFYRTASDAENITKRIKKFYFKNKEIGNETLQEMTDLYTDGWFTEGILDTLNLHVKYSKSPVYLYYFDYRGTNSASTIFGDTERDYGVCHSDEMFYLFKYINVLNANKSVSDSDNSMIDIMTQIWTNFAKTGKPTFDNEEIWKQVASKKNEYLHIKNNKDIKMNINLLKERYDFWSSLPTRKDKIHFEKEEF